MIQVYRYDENFIFVEPILIEEPDEDGKYAIPENCTTVQPPSFVKPKYQPEDQAWTEEATKEEIAQLYEKAASEREQSPIDILKIQNAKLTLQIAAAEKENTDRRKREAEQALMIAQLQQAINDLKGES
ncbi:hypothetical protein P5624_09695 [Bacillus subtilis]|nr:hypothetical protein P5624_09695 [Bacillus subtilis]WGD57525.1 hypothetical protein P5626_17005 [Bacillus subtilis]WGD82460.1 hypothetical protein P5659_09785 [Bacillus subtilis]WGD84489.1 hypothetical protein P5664_05865 [Bacillus subtilis]WGD95119.1 hypothetical protein P5642_20965 [Bacillus subtilis]